MTPRFRHHRLPFHALALLHCLLPTLSVAAAEKELPLYQRFRPVTSFPWREPGATLESVLKRIYQDPDETVRGLLLEAYLCTIPADQFPTAFERCLQLEEDDTPDELLSIFFRAWAEADPAAAWARLDPMVDTVMEQHPLSIDTWTTSIYAVNLPAVQKADFWPQYTHIDEFIEGLLKSKIPSEEQQKLLDQANAREASYLEASKAAQGKASGP